MREIPRRAKGSSYIMKKPRKRKYKRKEQTWNEETWAATAEEWEPALPLPLPLPLPLALTFLM